MPCAEGRGANGPRRGDEVGPEQREDDLGLAEKGRAGRYDQGDVVAYLGHLHNGEDGVENLLI